MGIATDLGDGAVHAVTCDRECFASCPGSGSRAGDGVCMGKRVSVDADDVVVFFCHDGHNLEPSFQALPLRLALV